MSHYEQKWERDRQAILEQTFSKRIAKNLDKCHPVPDDVLEQMCQSLSRGEGLYIHGPVGCGKTMLAAHLTAYYIKRNILDNRALPLYQDLFQSVPNLLCVIRDTFRETSLFSDMDIVNRLSQIDWLVLDDLGVEKTSDWVLQTLYLIVNNRYEALLPTIFTSNLSLDELAEKLGDRIPSRIVEFCNVWEMKGRDYRVSV